MADEAAGPAEQRKPATKKGGRRPKLDPELVAAALARLRGNLAAVARRFNVHRSSVLELINKRPALQQVCRDARESMTDYAEGALYRAVRKGEGWAVCFYLKTQGKSRGYIERQEISNTTQRAGQTITELTDEELHRIAAAGRKRAPAGSGGGGDHPPEGSPV